MEQIKAVLLGAGNRGQVYSDYCLDRPEELKIIAVIDIDDIRRNEAKEKYGVAEDMAFSSLDDFLAKKIECDFVINATMDEAHYQTSIKLLNANYNILLEKPITGNPEELYEIQALAKSKNLKVLVCHVLRYTPFFKAVKETIMQGVIGKPISFEMNEHVWIGHFIDSYVRGKWNSEKKCGSGFLLAKCCHDTDLMCWLNNCAKPVKVSSFGSRSLFNQSNAPECSTDFCYKCPLQHECLYSAITLHLEIDALPFQTWAGINKPIDEITKEEKMEYLKTSTYGRCAYKTDGDIVDRQAVMVEFSNGSIGTLNMIGATTKAGRWLHIVGEKGEIVGCVEEAKFTVREFKEMKGDNTFDEWVVNVGDKVVNSAKYGGHAGGDFGLMYDVVRYFNGDDSSISITSIDDSINGHLVVYGAEESRREEKVVKINEVEK